MLVFGHIPNLGTTVHESFLIERVCVADDLGAHFEHLLDREGLRIHEVQKVSDLDCVLFVAELLGNRIFLGQDFRDLVLWEGRLVLTHVEGAEQFGERHLSDLLHDEVVYQHGNLLVIQNFPFKKLRTHCLE